MPHFKLVTHLTGSLLLIALLSPPSATAESAAETAILPPLIPWDGPSRDLMAAEDDPWITPSERSGLTTTPPYDETIEWLKRLADAAPELQLSGLGRSLEGREIWMVVASREGATNPQELAANGRPTILAHAGIHSGEIDGKDAGMMLLRDLTVGGSKSDLLDRVNFLFIPILNTDGHERSSRFGRVNQRGPVEMGWRTNRRNLNLNRDFAKLETPEVRAVVRAIKGWDPLFYLDLHVTDGADYQYDITYGANGQHGWSPAINGWILDTLRPFVDAALDAQGHIPGPLVLTVNNRDLSDGFPEWTAGPRFSNGYGDARHLGTILLENHSLKPYDQRVLGTYVFLSAVLELIGNEAGALRSATEADRAQRLESVPLSWRPPSDTEPELVDFRGIRSELELSQITGAPVVRWTGEAIEQKVQKIVMTEPATAATRPSAYMIPASWADIARRLTVHGIQVERQNQAQTASVELYRLPEAALDAASSPFEGRARVLPGELTAETVERTFAAGSFRVSTDQPLGNLAMLLLEPESPDSYFQWGYLMEPLQRTEYIEPYVMEPMAKAMLAEDPELAAAFEKKLLTDSEFAASPRARLQWFYEKTPFFDQEHRLYPIARLP